MHNNTACENFHWTKISPSPATFVLQKMFMENIFTNAGKVLNAIFKVMGDSLHLEIFARNKLSVSPQGKQL